MVIKYIMIRNYEYAKNIPPHRHDFYEFVYYLDGSGTSIYGDTSFSFGPGDYVFINPNELHSERHVTPPKVICIAFQDEPFGLPSCHYSDPDGVIREYVERIRKEYLGKEIYYYDMIKMLMKEVVIRLQRKKPCSVPPDVGLKPIIDFVNAYYMTQIDIEGLAAESGYSSDHFRRLFKKTTGFNPKEYILRLRLENAKKLLATTSESLKSIAVNCGFEHYSQFSLFFKKQMKTSPTLYRDKYRGNASGDSQESPSP